MKATLAAAILLLAAAPAIAQEAPHEDAPRDGGWSVRWDEHPEVEWSGRLRAEFRARIQGDNRASRAAVDDGDGDGFDVGRRRVAGDGTIGRVLDFQVEREIEHADPWRDVFVNYRALRAAQIQAGQFKIPFGLEETTSGSNLDFMYRSIVSTRLAPGRDNGVMLHGRVGGRALRRENGGVSAHRDTTPPQG